MWFFFFYLGFLSWSFTNHRTAGEGGGHFFTLHHHFHPLHRQLNISRATTAGRPPLHIGSSRIRTGNLWFPSANRQPLSYVPLIDRRRFSFNDLFSFSQCEIVSFITLIQLQRRIYGFQKIYDGVFCENS